MAKKRASNAVKQSAAASKPQTVGESIIVGLKQALAWSRGQNDDVRVTQFQPPGHDLSEVRMKGKARTLP